MWARYMTSVRHTLVCCRNAPECVSRLSHHLVAPSFIYEIFYYNCLMRTLYKDEVSKQVQFAVNTTTMTLMECSLRLALRCGFLSVHACSRRLWECRCYRNFYWFLHFVCLVGWWLPTSVAQRSTVDVFSSVCLLWPPYVIGGAIIFLPCDFYLLSFFYLFLFPRLISAAADRMSTILLHMAWP